MSERTEEATPRRLRRAREEGDSGASGFASQALGLVAAVAVAPAAFAAIAARTSERLADALRAASTHGGEARVDAARVVGDVVALAAPVLLAAAVAATAATLVQTGGFVATKRLAPRLDRLDPVRGAAGLVSRARLFTLARALVAAGVVGYLVVAAGRTHAADFARVAGRLDRVAPLVASVARSIAWDAALAGLALAALDVVLVRLEHRRRLRMTREEVKREQRESEGDPRTKEARARARDERLASAAVANVRAATIVVVDAARVACALRYDAGDGDAAPVLVASGEGDAAERIARAARDHGVPVVQDAALARRLGELAIGEAIPEALYEAVAEVLRDAPARG